MGSTRLQLAVYCVWASITAVAGEAPSSVPGVNATHAAVDAMMALYNETTGIWDNDPWWESGVALRAVADYMLKTGSDEYLPVAYNTFNIQRAPLEWWPEGGGDFRADSTDDTGWWALALTTLYELTRDVEFLDVAKEDEAYMFQYWNKTTCGGGLIWNIPNGTYHNAISNELYLELTATLHNLIPGEEYYLNKSLLGWEWFKASGMINSENLVNDGLTDNTACVNNNATTWTYNQGVLIAGLTQLYKATSNTSLLETAQQIADATVYSAILSPGGILTEPCGTAPDCDPNTTAFKGAFMRGLAQLDAVIEEHPYKSYIQNNALAAYTNARNGSDFYGLRWQGPFDNASIGRQESAVNLLLAAL
ncbi:Uu.00g146910.m01.CDS01 [Anthostomella pinea]|uniref:Uu.00g146910.m01.CDS01 n=1 Tax=Anthostomella pinea TaxID=933095 RepID=A0AAI8YM46_9PEZI|nr:Uu.00g146910.m01.CDS01 [Anthostomella pinea]